MIIPPSLAAYPQFVLWIARPSTTRPGKMEKYPVDAQGRVCDAHDPRNWMTADGALAALPVARADGIGFVFTDRDPFFFLDLDDCLTADGWSQVAVDLCRQFVGCFVEVSQSGTGLHIIGSTANPPPPHGIKNKPLGVDLFTVKRYVAMTCAYTVGDPGFIADTPLTDLITRYFPPAPVTAIPDEWSTTPDAGWVGPSDDADLLARMLASKPSAAAAFSGRSTVQDLWAGSTDGHGGDHSAADAALCAHLAFWTGKDCERMDRMFRQSGLMRDKWDRGAGGGRTYGQLTILKAVGACERVLVSRETPDAPQPPDPLTGLRHGQQFMSIPQQVDHFRGCVYVRELHRIWIPDGDLLDTQRFRSVFGGYLFSMCMENEKTTRSAWEAFTESSGYNFPKVHEACFRPENAPGAVITEEGRQLINTYVPVTTPSAAGDPTPFLVQVAKLLPDMGDQQILLAYMAALVQHPGKKFYWCPLIQGVKGNGKTFLTTAIERAVGQKYSHRPNPEDISNKFNAWILGKLFIGIEEVYVADRRELLNSLKPLITNSRIDIQGKGDNQKTGDNRANFLMTTNYKEAVPVDDDERRYAPFFSAQQKASDLKRDGMDGDYFPRLYEWADGGGWAIINWFLRQYQIPDALNPARLCHRAPTTSSTAEAKTTSLGSVEQEILEAVEEGRPGFAGGWISSLALDQLLERRRADKQIPRARRRDLLRTLGYDWHPGLKDGRVNNAFQDVGGVVGKPKLFVRMGHLACNVTGASEIVRYYLEAQSGAPTAAGLAFAGAGG